ncbi:MAG: aminotransferase class V-fold PLP-dependent enzyme [Capsulimonadaceae bacterium]
MDNYRETEFAAAIENGIYLNHAASSPMAARVFEALTAAMLASSRSPEQFFMGHVLPALTSVRERLATLMGVDAQNLALMRNTSQGLAVVADGLALEPGDNVLAASCEYPSVVYPWYAQAWRGVETRVVPAEPDGTLSVDAFARRIDSRTRVLSLSWVQFATGFRADLAEFAALARDHDLIFVVDAIQALGVLPLNARDLGIDVVVTGSQKWLMGPLGTGGLYIRPEIMDRLHPVNAGACSVVDIFKFDPLDFSLKPTAQRFEEGSPNALGAVGLNAALGLLLEVGIPQIAAHVLDVTRHAADALTARGYRIASPVADDRRAGIVLFDHPAHDSNDLLQTLRSARVAASVRAGCVRFSPHFYNTTDEIDAAIAALPS